MRSWESVFYVSNSLVHYIPSIKPAEKIIAAMPTKASVKDHPQTTQQHAQQHAQRGRSGSLAPALGNNSLNSFELDTEGAQPVPGQGEGSHKGGSSRSEEVKRAEAQPNFAAAWLGAM